MIVTKIEERRKDFQKAVDWEEVRRKREEGSVQLRKVKRSEHIAKKRALTGKVAQSEEDAGDELYFSCEFISTSLQTLLPELGDEQLTDTQRLDKVLQVLVTSTDLHTLLLTTEAVKKGLSAEFNPPLAYVGLSPAAQKLVSLLACDNEDLLFEALWCITNLLSGPSAVSQNLVSFNLLPMLARLLTHANEDVCDQAVWALSNVAGDSVSMRNAVISLGVGEFIKEKFLRTSPLYIGPISNMVWLLSNLCRGVPAPSDELIQSILPVVPRALNIEKEEVVADTCWICSYVTDCGNRAGINWVLDLKVAPKLIELVVSPSHKVQTPALRTLGNIATGDNRQMQVLLDLGLLDKLSVVLTSKKKVARKEALWCLSNIAAGSPEQVELVLRSFILKQAIQAVADPDGDIKREAAWVLLNMTNSKDPAVHRVLASMGMLRTLVTELQTDNSTILLVLLESISNILRRFHTDGSHSEAEIAFEELGGLSHLERLQLNQSPKVYDKAVAIMNDFFGLVETEEQHNLQVRVPAGGFQFT